MVATAKAVLAVGSSRENEHFAWVKMEATVSKPLTVMAARFLGRGRAIGLDQDKMVGGV